MRNTAFTVPPDATGRTGRPVSSGGRRRRASATVTSTWSACIPHQAIQ